MAETPPGADEVAAVAAGGNQFAIDLFACLAADRQGNLFFSPSSIHTALALAYAGAAGPTAAEMSGVLHYGCPPGELVRALGELVAQLNRPALTHENKPAYQLSVANAVWLARGYPFAPEYLATVADRFDAKLAELDFSQPASACEAINDWVANATRGRIPNLVTPGVVPATTRLILTNAIYFKSNWREQFSVERTQDDEFRLADGATVTVPMMYQVDRFGYFETADLQGLELPYARNDLVMLILLPREPGGLRALEEGLVSGRLAAWREELKPTRVEVSLPRFEFASSFQLAAVLQEMGLTAAFDPAAADFSGITEAERLAISEVLHKGFVAVDENGTEAAAATAVVMLGTAMPPPDGPKIFRADHPFVFLIRHRSTDSILFMGRLADPRG